MDETKDKPARRALGRGLDSLLPAVPALQPAAAKREQEHGHGTAAVLLPVLSIFRNPYQTRKNVDQAALDELTRSVALHGVLQPLLVRPSSDGGYTLIAGERRLTAARAAGLTQVPAVVRAVNDAQALEWTIIENLQREDIDPIEQAQAFLRLHEEFQLNHEEIAKRTGKDRSSVTNFLRLLRLPAEVQEMVRDGRLSMGHAKVLLGLDPDEMLPMAQRMLQGGMSVRKAEAYLEGVTNQVPQAGKAKQQDPNVAEAESRLRSVLGLKVRIEDRKGKGRVIIEYGGLSDFDTIVNRLESRPVPQPDDIT